MNRYVNLEVSVVKLSSIPPKKGNKTGGSTRYTARLLLQVLKLKEDEALKISNVSDTQFKGIHTAVDRDQLPIRVLRRETDVYLIKIKKEDNNA
jgi:hypothetical protein